MADDDGINKLEEITRNSRNKLYYEINILKKKNDITDRILNSKKRLYTKLCVALFASGAITISASFISDMYRAHMNPMRHSYYVQKHKEIVESMDAVKAHMNGSYGVPKLPYKTGYLEEKLSDVSTYGKKIVSALLDIDDILSSDLERFENSPEFKEYESLNSKVDYYCKPVMWSSMAVFMVAIMGLAVGEIAYKKKEEKELETLKKSAFSEQ